MAVLLRFPHRSTAAPLVDRGVPADASTASIVILPCIRREAMSPASPVADEDPVLLKA